MFSKWIVYSFVDIVDRHSLAGHSHVTLCVRSFSHLNALIRLIWAYAASCVKYIYISWERTRVFGRLDKHYWTLAPIQVYFKFPLPNGWPIWYKEHIDYYMQYDPLSLILFINSLWFKSVGFVCNQKFSSINKLLITSLLGGNNN